VAGVDCRRANPILLPDRSDDNTIERGLLQDIAFEVIVQSTSLRPLRLPTLDTSLSATGLSGARRLRAQFDAQGANDLPYRDRLRVAFRRQRHVKALPAKPRPAGNLGHSAQKVSFQALAVFCFTSKLRQQYHVPIVANGRHGAASSTQCSLPGSSSKPCRFFSAARTPGSSTGNTSNRPSEKIMTIPVIH
jgi:hypothetical protein